MRYIKKIAVVLLVALQTSVALAQPHTAAEKDSSRSTRLAGVDSLTLAYYQRKQELLQATLKMLDSTQALHHLQFKIGQQSQPDLTIPDSIRLQDDVRRYDYIGEQLKRDQIDLGPVLDFGKALRAADALINKKKRKTPKMKNLPLPTPLEVDVLSVLWARRDSTGPALFA